MKRIIPIIMICMAVFGSATAQTTVAGASAQDVRMAKNGDYISVDMLLDLQNLEVGTNRAVLLTPVIKNGNDSVELVSVGIYGRNRYIYYTRNKGMITGEEEMSYKASEKPQQISYNTVIPYKEWMEGSSLVLNRKDYGCCSDILANADGMLVDKYRTPITEYAPVLLYVHPKAEEQKARSLSGTAYVDFPVNITEIRPQYRNNVAELGKIQNTIDSVNNDKDITIQKVSIKGFASPEGSYALNERLAKGRTASLEKYVQELYNFEKGVIATSYEPEDWAGLRKYVENSSLENKDAILAIIDGNDTPDRKDWTIKTKYNNDYQHLLAYCYPALRHSDYKIDYVIREFTSIDEIKEIMSTSPHKLSLEEFHRLAQEYEAGSEEFNNVFETAVKMYPKDEIANLNAANAAMERKDLVSAEKYLAKAGNTAQAVYARGNLAAMQRNFTAAAELFRQAQQAGINEAAAALEQIDEIQ